MASKTKVTGLRQHEHIGRLELVAAVMGVALGLKIAMAWKIPMQDITYFTGFYGSTILAHYPRSIVGLHGSPSS